jgi:hypothetical protein
MSPHGTIKTCKIYHVEIGGLFLACSVEEYKGGGSLHYNAHNSEKMELR